MHRTASSFALAAFLCVIAVSFARAQSEAGADRQTPAAGNTTVQNAEPAAANAHPGSSAPGKSPSSSTSPEQKSAVTQKQTGPADGKPTPSSSTSLSSAPAPGPASASAPQTVGPATTQGRGQQATSADQAAQAGAPAASSGQSAIQTGEEPKRIDWAFNGMRGTVDRTAAQRGFQVYKQVCSACHSMNLIAYRSLSGIGFGEAEIKALAAEKQVPDTNDKGEQVMRPAQPSDHLVPPYPNEDASRAANGGAYPPDLSVMVKARHHGPDYVYSLLTGFAPAPAGETPVANKYYNPYYPGHWISMPPPLSDNVVTYQDGTPATVDQMARDVVTFLQWAAEPEMEARKEMGLKVLLFLAVMTVFFYLAKKRIWRNLKH